MSGQAGQLLVATRDLIDPNFLHSVVLLVQHDEQGAVGLVLNRPTGLGLPELWKKLHGRACRYRGSLHRGGPCEGPLMAVHDDPTVEGLEILPGLRYSAEREALSHLVESPPEHLRIFAGYAGWSGGQLEAELEEGSWLLTPATTELIFNDPAGLWPELTKSILGATMLSLLGIKHVPDDLRLN